MSPRESGTRRRWFSSVSGSNGDFLFVAGKQVPGQNGFFFQDRSRFAVCGFVGLGFEVAFQTLDQCESFFVAFFGRIGPEIVGPPKQFGFALTFRAGV